MFFPQENYHKSFGQTADKFSDMYGICTGCYEEFNVV